MRPELRKQALSTEDPAFLATVEEALASGKELITLRRRDRAAGAKDCYLLRNKTEFDAVLQTSRESDSISIFFKDPAPIRGRSDEELEKKALEYLKSQLAVEEDVVLIRIDGPGSEVEDWCWTDSAAQLSKWLRENRGAPVAIGQLPFWNENSDAVVTAYIPAPDGTVRFGYY